MQQGVWDESSQLHYGYICVPGRQEEDSHPWHSHSQTDFDSIPTDSHLLLFNITCQFNFICVITAAVRAWTTNYDKLGGEIMDKAKLKVAVLKKQFKQKNCFYICFYFLNVKT